MQTAEIGKPSLDLDGSLGAPRPQRGDPCVSQSSSACRGSHQPLDKDALVAACPVQWPRMDSREAPKQMGEFLLCLEDSSGHRPTRLNQDSIVGQECGEPLG